MQKKLPFPPLSFFFLLFFLITHQFYTHQVLILIPSLTCWLTLSRKPPHSELIWEMSEKLVSNSSHIQRYKLQFFLTHFLSHLSTTSFPLQLIKSSEEKTDN